MTVEEPDPLLVAFRALAVPTRGRLRDAQVRSRCHAVMKATSAARPERSGQGRAQVIDHVLSLAVVVYGLIVVAEALRLAGVV